MPFPLPYKKHQDITPTEATLNVGGDGEMGITWKNQLTSSKRVERDWENDEKMKKGYLSPVACPNTCCGWGS